MISENQFSIILPVKNGGLLVRECILSILNQTRKDFNLIILENKSTDGSGEWMGSLMDSRIVYIPSVQPLSIEENWHRVLHVRKNKFITIIGHDDILSPDYLEIMGQLIFKYPTASLYQTHFVYIDIEGKVISPCQPMPLQEDISSLLKSFMTHSIDMMGTGFMMRSRDYDAIGGIPLQYPNLLFADVELWLKLTQLEYKITSPVVGFYYRVHQSTTKKSSDEKLLTSFIEIVSFIKSLKTDNASFLPIVNEYGIDFIHYHCVSLAHRVLRTATKDRQTISVNKIISTSKALANQLIPGNSYRPLNDFNMVLAKVIDSNEVFRNLFLLFKKIFPKPLIK